MSPRFLVCSLLWMVTGALAAPAGSPSLPSGDTPAATCALAAPPVAAPGDPCALDSQLAPAWAVPDESWRGAVGGLVLSFMVFGLLGAAAATRRARERSEELGPLVIRLPEPPSPGAQARLQELLRERAALQAELRAAGIEVDSAAQGAAQPVSRAA